MAIVRDFIYMDTERLSSLYSQVFEGVVEQIIRQGSDTRTDTDTQEGGAENAGATLETRLAQASYETESRVLSDHMYSLLIEKLHASIQDASQLTLDNYQDVLPKTYLMKVTGLATLLDYERLTQIMDEFEKIGRALNYLPHSQVYKQAHSLVSELESNKRKAKGNQKKAITDQINNIKKLVDEDVNYKSSELYQDPKMLEMLSYLTGLFYGDGFDISVEPNDGGKDFRIRSLLDKKWMRIPPHYLRALHGGDAVENLTLIGQITRIPRRKETATEGAQAYAVADDPQMEETIEQNNDGATEVDLIQELDALSQQQATQTQSDVSLRDAFLNMFNSYNEIEKTFAQSNDKLEIIVWPIAVYREIIIDE